MANIVNGVHEMSEADKYVVPESAGLRENIKRFMGKKLGIMMHWAPGCQLGTYESWGLCDGSAAWSQEDVDWTDDMDEFKQQYIDANKTFNPVKFRPDKWAEFAKECGFKYLLFTTKHHDGFCMWDTKTTNYKITDPSCPFHTHKYADIVGNLYDEFRKQGLAISVYFSKPDWHSDYFWSKDFPKPVAQRVNYSIKENPKLWEKFIEFTHEQITELTTQYGKVDALWLDGGWVKPDNYDQDIRLGELVKKIRSTTQPDLIVCDRTVGGEYENILTPEQEVPSEALTVPWESCITVGNAFSFHYTDTYKSSHELIMLLINIVAKGGNLALNIPPQPDGNLPLVAMQSVRGMGEWLKINGEGIYDTTICNDFAVPRRSAFTQKDDAMFMFCLYDETIPVLPRFAKIAVTRSVESATLLRTGENVRFEQDAVGMTLFFDNIDVSAAKTADCIKIKFKLL